MGLYDRSEINWPAAIVWPFITTAEHFRQWNDTIVTVEATGPFQLGQTFPTKHHMSGREMRCRSMVAALDPGRLLELQHGNCSGRNAPRGLERTERVTIEERSGHTVVRKEIEVRNHSVPWILQPLIWFVTQFGKPAGRDELKDMCERRA